MENEYDVIIIGGGPAGLTAGLYTSRSRLKTLLLEKLAPGGQVALTDFIENYPGFPDGINGIELVQRMEAQSTRWGLQLENGEVTQVSVAADSWKQVSTEDTKYRAKSVIIATGAGQRLLGIPGETELRGRGVSYCATCDGPFFKEKEVIVVGGGNSAVEEGLYLTRFAKKVTVIHRRDQLRASKLIQERAFANPKISFIWDSVPIEITGIASVESVIIKNVKTKLSSTIPTQGVFVYVGRIPKTNMVEGLVELDEFGYVVTDLHMATSVPGIFAAGDVRKTILRQCATAVGDGAMAGYAAEKYVDDAFPQ